VRVYRRPMGAAITIVVELPQMQKLVDRAGIGLKVSDQLLVVTALLERRKANLLVELHGLCHCTDSERIGSQFIEGHWTFPPCEGFEPPLRSRTKRHWSTLSLDCARNGKTLGGPWLCKILPSRSCSERRSPAKPGWAAASAVAPVCLSDREPDARSAPDLGIEDLARLVERERPYRRMRSLIPNLISSPPWRRRCRRRSVARFWKRSRPSWRAIRPRRAAPASCTGSGEICSANF